MIEPLYQYDDDHDGENTNGDHDGQSRALAEPQPQSWPHFVLVSLIAMPILQGIAQGLAYLTYNKLRGRA